MGTYINGKFLKSNQNDQLEVCDKELSLEFFDFQNYAIFGWLGCEHRNYSQVPPLSAVKYEPKKDCFLVHKDALLTFNYDDTFEDRRTIIQTGPNSYNGSHIAEVGSGVICTYRDAFSERFMESLELLRQTKASFLEYFFD